MLNLYIVQQIPPLAKSEVINDILLKQILLVTCNHYNHNKTLVNAVNNNNMHRKNIYCITICKEDSKVR